MGKVKRQFDCHEGCPVEASLEIIGGRWKGVLLYHLMQRKHRFSEFQRNLPGLTQRVLTQQLREMEADGLISRTIYPEVPPRVEYALTEKGQTLKPVIDSLFSWGVDYGRPTIATRQAAA